MKNDILILIVSCAVAFIGFGAVKNGVGDIFANSTVKSDPETDRQAITKLLNDQAEAWSNNDLDGFMEGYWKSDLLTFNSGGKITNGWQATYDRYRERYPDQQMGKLTFSQLQVNVISDQSAVADGRWDLETTGGQFSLMLNKIDGQWRIVRDHTTSDPK